MNFYRHRFIDITDKGRHWAFQQLESCLKYDKVKKLIIEGYEGIKIPGITRREDAGIVKGAATVGFSSPYLHDGQRLRIAACIPQTEIERIFTPYEVINFAIPERTRCLEALTIVRDIAGEFGVNLGILGSAGLEIYTKLPYTYDGSDLDLLIEAKNLNDTNYLKDFYISLKEVGKKNKCNIDLELEFSNGYGIKVAELFMETDMLLGKSINDVKLIPRKSIIQIINDK